MRRTAAGILVVLSVALGGCGDDAGGDAPERACTEIGCQNGVTLQLPPLGVPTDERVRVQACVEDGCKTVRMRAIEVGQLGPFVEMKLPEDAGDVAVRVTVRDAAGEVIVRGRGTAPVQRSRPNGPDCPPECLQVRVLLKPGSEKLVPF